MLASRALASSNKVSRRWRWMASSTCISFSRSPAHKCKENIQLWASICVAIRRHPFQTQICSFRTTVHQMRSSSVECDEVEGAMRWREKREFVLGRVNTFCSLAKFGLARTLALPLALPVQLALAHHAQHRLGTLHVLVSLLHLRVSSFPQPQALFGGRAHCEEGGFCVY
jgi:hypothetical protein